MLLGMALSRYPPGDASATLEPTPAPDDRSPKEGVLVSAAAPVVVRSPMLLPGVVRSPVPLPPGGSSFSAPGAMGPVAGGQLGGGSQRRWALATDAVRH